MTDHDNHPFWQFSIRVYAAPGVADACLALQTGYRIDVNILLCCCWAASIGADPLPAESVTAARMAVAGWNAEIVQGLRAVRDRLKSGYDGFDAEDVEALRQRVLGFEINAEHKEQIRLAETVAPAANDARPQTDRLEACTANIAAYFMQAAKPLSPADRNTHLARIVAAVFPDLRKGAVTASLAEAFEIP